MQICFFSDSLTSNFLPLTLTRPVTDLRLGIFTIEEKWKVFFDDSIFMNLLPEYLEAVFPQPALDQNQKTVWINNRFLPNPELVTAINELKTGQVIMHQSTPVAASLNGDQTSEYLQLKRLSVEGLSKVEYKKPTNFITQLWDLLALNGEEIQEDLKHIRTQNLSESPFAEICSSLHPDKIHVAENAIIEPGATLIASDGPVYIGPKATIEAGSILKGPVAVCEEATVKMAARIYNSSTIGPVCKIAGEVSNTIFHSYSNKAHDGFVGSSLIGQWCNLGADTNTSNLKNNYGKVLLRNWETGEETESGVQFFGTVMGDHSKTAINTQLNTGTMCGVSANIFQSGFPPKLIPSFSWVGDRALESYRFDKAVETMQAMMKRRNITPTDDYLKMMEYIFKHAGS